MSTPDDQNLDSTETNEPAVPVIAVLPLWKVFLVAVGGSILMAVVIALAMNLIMAIVGMGETAGTITGFVLFYAFYLVTMWALWANAYNTETRLFGHLARGFVVVSVLFFAAILVGMIVDAV